jgi:hypothetical protein
MERFFWPAVVASLAVHGVVLGGLLTRDFAIAPPVAAPREYVAISFARRAPPPAPAPEPVQEESTASSLPAPSSPSPASSFPPAPPPSSSFPRTRESIADKSPDSLDSRARGNDEGEAPASVDGTALRAQISSFVLQQRDSYTQDFVEDCWIERQEGERRECEGAREGDRGGDAGARSQVTALFKDLTRNERHARLSDEFEARNAQLKELAAAGGVLGALAMERRSINNEYRAYLNGNRNTAASNYVMNTFTNSGNPQAMSGFLQFICKKMPCIYEFTGFSVVMPEEMKEAADEADTFPYTPTLFGSRK